MNEAVYISLYARAFRKVMNSFILSPAVEKIVGQFGCSGLVAS